MDLTLLLLGQPELKDIIDTNKQFAQRIAVRCHLDHLGEEETKRYILHRLSIVGRTKPIFTDDSEYAPVKIPTSATRDVLIWDTNSGQYNKIVGTQEDAFYHLHFSKNYRTTLGCIRLDSAQDAIDIANDTL